MTICLSAIELDWYQGWLQTLYEYDGISPRRIYNSYIEIN